VSCDRVPADERLDKGENEDEGDDPMAAANFDVRVLLGKRDGEMDLVFARQVAEVLFAESQRASPAGEAVLPTTARPRPLLLALALRDPSLEDLAVILRKIQQLLKSAPQ